MIERPPEGEYNPFYASYLALVPEGDLLSVLAAQPKELQSLVKAIPPDRETHRYGEGKWSVREVLGHVTDVERVFGYRALCISRLDQTPLPGFDENDYVAHSSYAETPVEGLAAEFASLRSGNLALLRRLEPARWLKVGNANGSPVSVRALAFIMAGHFRHHLAILRDRYGVGAPT
jgi:hypothetical protein